MAKKNHLERIKDLIKLDKSDLEIRVSIYNEYGIYYTVNDIINKRKSENTKTNIKNTKTQLEFPLVKNILLNNVDIPLNKNEIEANTWEIVSNINLNKNVFIDFSCRTITFKNKHNKSKSDLFKEFLNNLSNQRNLNRNPEVDLFFENLQEFYEDL